MSVILVIGDTVNPLRIGSSRDFTCTSTGSPAPSLVWTKSDRVIRGSGGVLRYVTLTGGPNRVWQCVSHNALFLISYAYSVYDGI